MPEDIAVPIDTLPLTGRPPTIAARMDRLPPLPYVRRFIRGWRLAPSTPTTASSPSSPRGWTKPGSWCRRPPGSSNPRFREPGCRDVRRHVHRHAVAGAAIGLFRPPHSLHLRPGVVLRRHLRHGAANQRPGPGHLALPRRRRHRRRVRDDRHLFVQLVPENGAAWRSPRCH